LEHTDLQQFIVFFYRKVPFLVADAAEPVIAGIAVESAPVPEKDNNTLINTEGDRYYLRV
jgi:hypothetical protein